MVGTLDRATALALLTWYRDMGIDLSLADTPVDWFARREPEPSGAKAVELPRKPAVPSPPATASVRPAIPIVSGAQAADLARGAATLEALETVLAQFDGCALKTTAKTTCFYRGAPKARLAIIGEAPGREEDLAGKPFVGPAGRLLDKMLAAIGFGESDVHITNVVYWRPPGNRVPTPIEAELCRPFLERQMELVGPEIVLLMGGVAAKQIIGGPDGIMRLRGSWREIAMGSLRVQVMPTLHPAYLLRTPLAKRLAWRDFLAVLARLRGA